MTTSFVSVDGLDFVVNGEKIVFRGFGLGNWLNLEHFMIGLPGTESQIRQAVEEVYGERNARLFWRKYRECYIGEEDFRFLKSLGINAVRIPFNYHLFESDQTPYRYDEDGFAEIDRVLALCEKYRIYAILDLHAAPGGQNPDWHSDNPTGENLFWAYADFRRRVIALWRFIAEHYKDNPWIAAYDLLNEPVSSGYPAELVPAFFDELVKAVREADPNHMLFVEGDAYARDFRLFQQFADPNVACTFHYYAFFNAASLSGPGQAEKLEKALFQSITLEDIQKRLQRPVWCGETGIPLSQGERDKHESLLRDTLEVFKKYDISWTLWCYKDARSMGAVYPRADSEWMRFSRKACQGWDFWREFNDWSAVDRLGAQYSVPLHEVLRRRLRFRLLADNQLVLAEKFRDLLRRTPFEEFLALPESFRFERCETWPAVIDLVKKHTDHE